MQGLIREAEAILDENEEGTAIRDAAIILSRAKNRALRNRHLRIAHRIRQNLVLTAHTDYYN